MPNGLISGDNHIDLTYCPPDLWSCDRCAGPQVDRDYKRRLGSVP